MIAMIEANAGERDISAGELAEKAAKMNGLGSRDMTAVMRFLTGDTMLDYIKERKLMASYRYLVEDGKPSILKATEIAGFDNQCSFTKRFSQEFGMPPGEAIRRKDLSCVSGPLDWDAISSGSGRGGWTAGTERPLEQEMVFGLPRDLYDRVMKASEQQNFYGFEPLFSRVAYELYLALEEDAGETAAPEGHRTMEDCFRFVDSIRSSYSVDGELHMSDRTPEQLEEEVRAVAESRFYRFMFFECGLSVSTTEYLMEDRIMPTEEELMEMDPMMIRAFSLSEEFVYFNFYFFKKAYEAFTKVFDDVFHSEEFMRYLEYLDMNIPIETALEQVILEPTDDEIAELAEEAGPDWYIDPDDIWDPFQEEEEEEERWHNVIFDLDLDEENAYYQLEDLTDQGYLDF